jgi:metal-sulfur cluster biosynthetic enzyme
MKRIFVEIVIDDAATDLMEDEMVRYLKEVSDEHIQFNVMNEITRVEVIDHSDLDGKGGRAYVGWNKKVSLSLQDERRTLKIFAY